MIRRRLVMIRRNLEATVILEDATLIAYMCGMEGMKGIIESFNK